MGMQSHRSTDLVKRSETVVAVTRQMIQAEGFCGQHRANSKCFTRRRRLPFMNVVVLLLQKTLRSIQLHLHDFFAELQVNASVGAASWCEARMKLRHSAFIELNERAILEIVYKSDNACLLRRWKGHRLIGIDGSLIRLPNEQDLGEYFGWVECSNQQGSTGRYPQARLLILTDVLNRIAINTRFVPWQQGERSLAMEQISILADSDIALLDRGFAGYELFAQFVAHGRKFVCRCQDSTFSAVNELFARDQAAISVVATLKPHRELKAQANVPTEITIRFVTVRLQNGDLEVLATNLLEADGYATEEFGDLYNHRWNIETYYGLIKGRLDLENFTGRSIEAVQQDVYATIFLSNLESVLTAPTQAELDQKSTQLLHAQRVNRAVSFHAIKARMVDLLLSNKPVTEVVQQLQTMFLANPTSHRPEREIPRLKVSSWRAYHHRRSTRKIVF